MSTADEWSPAQKAEIRSAVIARRTISGSKVICPVDRTTEMLPGVENGVDRHTIVYVICPTCGRSAVFKGL